MSPFDRHRHLRLLLLESDGARLYARQLRAPERIRELARFTPDAAGQQALSAWLEKAKGEPVVVLVNLPEEAYIRETIPRLRGGERSALIKRRLRQHFADNPFVMASSLGEIAGRRQEERLLLSALPGQPLQGWLAALRQTPIAGIHGVAQGMAEVLRHAACLPPACLLLSPHTRALRQTLLQDGRVVFSRLSPAPGNEEKSLWIAEETARLYAYLAHRQYVEAGVALPVFLLAEAPDASLAAAFAHPDMTPLKIKAPGIGQCVANLSGGNQQKVVVGKWLMRDAKLVIFDEPTRGIDVASKIEIYNIINELKKQGIGVMFVSSELPEVLGMSDRILVMCNGRITANLETKNTNQEEVLKYATQYA